MLNKKIVLSGNDDVATLLEDSFLKREGFSLITVTKAEFVARIVEAEAPSLALLDWSYMADRALEVTRTVKQDRLLSETPVMILLPEGGDDLSASCLESGCDALVTRPLRAGTMMDAACRLLGISRRLARRFPVDFSLELEESGNTGYRGSCVNLNAGGMYISTEALFPVDTLLQVRFVLPGDREALRCPIRVAWVNHPEWRKKDETPCGMGVEFVASGRDYQARKVIQRFLDNLPPAANAS